MTEENQAPEATQEQAQEEVSLDGVTVNGVPVSDLSESGQAIFRRLYTQQKEANEISQKVEELTKEYHGKQAVIKELSEIVGAEVNAIKENAESDSEA